jgi:hypothetical protein
MTNKTFTIAGMSTLNGVVKVRFANKLAERIKVLTKNEHTDIHLIDLGTALTKENCVKALAAHNDFKDAEAQALFTAFLAKSEPKAVVAKKVAKAVVAKETTAKVVVAKKTTAKKTVAKKTVAKKVVAGEFAL